MRYLRVLAGLGTILGFLVLFALGLAPTLNPARPTAAGGLPTATSSPCPPSWQIVASPNPGPSYTWLFNVSAVSATDVWSFGSYFDGAIILPVTLHWDGQQWNQITTPNGPRGTSLHGGAARPGEVWAVGGEATCCNTSTQTLYWDGVTWSMIAGVGGRPANLDAAAVIGPHDLWAVGHTVDPGNPVGALVARVSTSTLTLVPNPDPGGAAYLNAVAVHSPTDAWIVGYADPSSGERTLIEHWDGAAWSLVPSPNPSGVNPRLQGVAVTGPNDAWAAGSFYNSASGHYEPIIEHWDGTQWSLVPVPTTPTGGSLQAVTALAANDVWAVGDDNGGNNLVLHWDGAAWSIVPSPNGGTQNRLTSVSAVGPTDVWAVGTYQDSAGHDQALTLHYSTACPTGQSTPTVTATATVPASQTPTPTATTCTQGAWSQAVPYPQGIADQAVVAHNGLLYSFGGGYYTPSSAAYKYDPSKNSWTAIAPLPTALYGMRGVSDGTGIYLLAGHDQTSNQNLLWRYDPSADTYTPLAPALTGLIEHSPVYLNGKIYRIGGCFAGTRCRPRDTLEIYDISTNTWSSGARYPEPIAFAATVTDGRYIYGAGGWDVDGQPTTKTYRYDPATDTWDDAAIDDMPVQRSTMAAGWLDGRWVLAGGYIYPGALSSVLTWDPTGATWSTQALPNMLQPRAWVNGATIGTAFYVVGGLDAGNQPSPAVQVLKLGPCLTPSPATSATTTPSPSPALCLSATGEQVLCTATATPTKTPTRTPTGTTTRLASPTPTDCPVYFVDVPPDGGFYAFVRCLACRGIVGGYPCGGPGEPCPGQYYRPTNNVTRGQVSKIVAQSAALADPIGSSQQTFQDVTPGSTFHVYIERLASRGIVGGYPCGGALEPCVAPLNRPYFRPNNNVTRGQLAKITSGAAGWTETPTSQTFQDVPPGSTFYLYVQRLSGRGVIGGYPCGGVGEPCVAPANRPYYRPNNNATRGQMAKIAAEAFFPNCVTPGPTPTATNTPTHTPSPLPTAPPGGACPMFPANNIWNRNIAAQPTHVRSPAYISTMGTGSPLHPDFGAGLYNGGPIGIPYTTVPGNQPPVPITFDIAGESDPGPYPIPTNAPVEGGPTSTGDRHVIVIDRGSCTLYEMWASYPHPDGSWEAGSGAKWRLDSNALRPPGWTSADAAGLPILPGLASYDEVATGVIRHALRFTTSETQEAYLWPARHLTYGYTDPNVPPMGLRLRLKASINISTYPPQARVILQALKDYGMFLADNGGSIFLSGLPDARWNNDDLRTLRQIYASDFEAIDESGLMIDPNSGESR